MRHDFFLNAVGALIAFAFAFAYWQSVAPVRIDTVEKMRLRPDAAAVMPGDPFVPDAIETVRLPVVDGAGQGAVGAEDLAWAMDASAAVREALAGRRYVQAVQPGAFLETRHFYSGRDLDLTARIAPGLQAFSFEFETENTVAAFVAPGAVVDVIGILEDRSRAPRAEIFLEAVEIMAVGPITSAAEYRDLDAPDFDIVTVQAPPDAVRRFLELQSQARARPSLVLRGPSAAAAQ